MTNDFSQYAITPSKVKEAAECIKDKAKRTPALTSAYFDQRTGKEVFFKCESFQKV